MVQNANLTQQTTIIAGILTVGVTILGTYIYQKLKKPQIPREWRAVGKVTKMYIYPLKSGKKIEVDKAECTKRGLMEMEKSDTSLRLRDRCFVTYHKDNHEYRNARHYPQLVLVECKAHGMNSIVLSAPDMNSLCFTLPDKVNNEQVIVRHVLDEEILCIDCGNEVADWISQYILGKDSGLRLAFCDGTFKRNEFQKVFKEFADYYKMGLRNESVGLVSDVTALHIINQASIRDVNTRIGNSELTAVNFRANLLIDGPNLEPYEEDKWEWIKIGDVVIKNVMECIRCTVPTVDTETGMRRKDREPLTTMGKYRMENNLSVKGPVMGILLEVFETGIIAVGDTVYIGGNIAKKSVS